MEFLEVPYEPVSFRFYYLAASSAGGSLLPWVAMLAAALVGFWRMRLIGSRSDTSPLFTSSPASEAARKSVTGEVQIHKPELRDTESEVVTPSCSGRHVEAVCTPKIRFMAYFDSEDSIGCCHVEDEDEQKIEDDGACEESDCREANLPWETEKEDAKYWAEKMVMRRGDLGWYSYQDIAALNGSVVRLWDGVGDRSLRRRKGGLTISYF